MSGRLVVLVSGSGSNMEALIDACEQGAVPATVEAVFADRPCRAGKIAEERGIESAVVTPGDFPSRAAWGDGLLRRVRAVEPDLVVSAGFMRLLPESFVAAFEGRLINLHPSLLPAFPGAHAVRDALEHGVKITGTTIHFIDSGVDTGPILMQESVPVLAGDDEDSLHERIKTLEHGLLPKACRLVLEGSVRLDGRRVVVEDP